MKATQKATIGDITFLFYSDSIKYMPGYGKKDNLIYGAILAENIAITIKDTRVTFREGTEIAFYHTIGKVAYGSPDTDVTATLRTRKFTFRSGMRLTVSESGTVREGYLAADTKIKMKQMSVTFRRGVEERETISFTDDGAFRQGFLAGVNELPVGGRAVRFMNFISFSGAEQVTHGMLAAEERFTVGVNTFTFIKGDYHGVSFYESGAVSGAYLAAVAEADCGGVRAKIEYNVLFSEKGSITRALLAEELSFGGKQYAANDTVEFSYDAAGKLKNMTRFKYPER